jgi:hypothetical protein
VELFEARKQCSMTDLLENTFIGFNSKAKKRRKGKE